MSWLPARILKRRQKQWGPPRTLRGCDPVLRTSKKTRKVLLASNQSSPLIKILNIFVPDVVV